MCKHVLLHKNTIPTCTGMCAFTNRHKCSRHMNVHTTHKDIPKYTLAPITHTHTPCLSSSFIHRDTHRGINKQPNKPTDDVPNRELSVSVVNVLCVASLRLMVFKRGCCCQSEPSTGTFTYLIRWYDNPCEQIKMYAVNHAHERSWP